MKVAIIYDSRTGTTAKAAESMGQILQEGGHSCTVQSIAMADPSEMSDIDLICVGSWVQGLFIIMQHPTEGTMQFIQRLGDLSGTKAVVFCTYKLAAGSTLNQMGAALEGKGAEVVGRFKYRGPDPNSQFLSFASTLN